MNGNDQYLEAKEREWGNFDEVKSNSSKLDKDDDTDQKLSIHHGLYWQMKIQQLGEREQERADELRDSMREDGVGGY